LVWCQPHLLAQPFGYNGNVDEGKQFVSIRTNSAPVKGGENSGVAAALCIIKGRIGEVAVDMQGTAASEIKDRKWAEVVVISAAHYCTLVVVRHNEGQRRCLDLARVDWNCVFHRYVQEHPPQPVTRNGSYEVRSGGKLCTTESRCDSIAPERDRVV
jgi:hypothetical protein